MAIAFLGVGLFGIGYFLTAVFFPGTDRQDKLIISFPLGAGLFTLTLFCINQGLGLPLYRPLLIAFLSVSLVVLAGAAFLRGAKHKERKPTLKAGSFNSFTPLAKLELALILLLFFLLAVVGTIVPVWNWDANSQYLPIAREIFMEKSLSTEVGPSPVDLVRAFPPGYTLLVSSGYILHGGILHPWARFLSPLYAGLILLLLYRMGSRHLNFSPEVILGGILLCTSLPLFYEFSIAATSTICFCFQALASLYFILEYWEAGERRSLALAGIFLGLSYWTSYTGAVLIPCVLLLLILLSAMARLLGSEELRGLRLSFFGFLLIFSIVFAICVPHMLRNYLVLGNPIYPALYNRLGGIWINDWSIEHLIPRIVPARTFFLRPRWEIFHEGFFIQLLFFLFLFSQPWYKHKKSLFLALFCLFYLGFYLKFLTWPRGAGTSIKLLLPSIIPACLFAGERFNRILRRNIPLWQGAVILATIPVWLIVMLRDETIYLAVRSHLTATRFPDVIYMVRALLVDFDELLIWVGVALCLFIKSPPPKRVLGRLLPALFLFAVASRSLGEGVHQLTQHISAYTKGRSYSFWNAAAFPRYLPEAKWLDKNLPQDTVVGSFDNRTYIYPRRVFPLDSSKLWPLYQGMDIEECLGLLRQNGITHLCLSDYTTKSHPLFGKSPIFEKLGDPAYLPLLYKGPIWQEPGHELKVYGIKGPNVISEPSTSRLR